MHTKTILKEILSRLAISPSGFTFDPRSGRTFTLNETGLTVIAGLRSGLATNELCRQLSDEYDILPERVEASLQDFVSQLVSELS